MLAAYEDGIGLHVIILTKAKEVGSALVVGRSFCCANGFQRLTRDYERHPETLAGLSFVVFTMLMLAYAGSIKQSA